MHMGIYNTWMYLYNMYTWMRFLSLQCVLLITAVIDHRREYSVSTLIAGHAVVRFSSYDVDDAVVHGAVHR